MQLFEVLSTCTEMLMMTMSWHIWNQLGLLWRMVDCVACVHMVPDYYLFTKGILLTMQSHHPLVAAAVKDSTTFACRSGLDYELNIA